ncbi:hypothetical protein LguiA_030681 [Lonicera macranthoides]
MFSSNSLPLICFYKPAPETLRMPVCENAKVDHQPAGGHWFATGLFPNVGQILNVPGGNRVSLHNQMMPYANPGSYGSLGSHGSYNDGIRAGSYGDNSNMIQFSSPVGPSGTNIHGQVGGVPILGTSPDARPWIIHQCPHSGNGLGLSPTRNFAPMSFGSSLSQFTPPNSTNGQVSAGGCPGHYGPCSPARGNCHKLPLGKVVAVGQFNRRKNSAYSGSLPSQEISSSSSSPLWKRQYLDGS